MRLAIYGSGGLGTEVYELAEIVNQGAYCGIVGEREAA